MSKKFLTIGSTALIGAVITGGSISAVVTSFDNTTHQSLVKSLEIKNTSQSPQTNIPTFTKGQITTYKVGTTEYKIYTPNDDEYNIDQNMDLIGLTDAAVAAHPNVYFNLEIPATGVKGLSLDKQKNPTFAFLDKVVRVDLTKSSCFKINFVRKLPEIKEIIFSDKIKKLTANGIIENPKLDTLTNLDLINVPIMPQSAFRQIAISKLDKMADNLNTIERLAFADNDKLKTVDLSNTALTKISEFAFRTTNIEHFYAPDSLITVENGIFANEKKDDTNTTVLATTKGTNRYQVNLPAALNTPEKFATMGILKPDGQVYTATDSLPVENLILDFNKQEMDSFVAKQPTDITPENLKIEFNKLPFAEKVKMVNVTLEGHPEVIPFDVVRNITSSVDANTQDVSIQVELNSLYSTTNNKTTVLKYVTGTPPAAVNVEIAVETAKFQTQFGNLTSIADVVKAFNELNLTEKGKYLIIKNGTKTYPIQNVLTNVTLEEDTNSPSKMKFVFTKRDGFEITDKTGSSLIPPVAPDNGGTNPDNGGTNPDNGGTNPDTPVVPNPSPDSNESNKILNTKAIVILGSTIGAIVMIIIVIAVIIKIKKNKDI